MEQIEMTSVNNELVKETVELQQKKYRDESKKFLLEGFKAIEEAFGAGIEILPSRFSVVHQRQTRLQNQSTI